MKTPKYLDQIVYFFLKKFNHHRYIIFLAIPLLLSAFTHLWNPIGFPSVWVVEGQYMHRTMHILEGLGHHHEQSSIYPHPYDHPYFGQYFLAGMLAIVGYPGSLHLSSSTSSSTTTAAHDDTIYSIEVLHLIPRVLMGVLAIFDTFLLYKISERRYNMTIALVASILFAVMPITWLLRKILLESLLLPLLLSSILFALYTKDLKRNYNLKNYKDISLVLLSGIFLGLAILTKIPIFTMIPLVGYLVYTSSNKNWKVLGIWFIPVILIPLIWPVNSILLGDFDLWIRDVVWHTERQRTSDSAIGSTLLNSLKYLFQIEPVLLILGIAGIVFAEIKRDFMLLLWTIPFLIFLFIVDFVSFFHLIPLLPAFCIAAARMIIYLSNRISYKKIHQILPFAIISGIGIFGFINITMLITTNVTSSYFEAYAFIVQHLANVNSNENNNKDTVTMIGRHWTRGLFWIPRYVYDIDLDFKKVDNVYDIPVSVETEKAIIIVDNTIKRSISNNKNDIQNGQQLNLYYNTIPIATFENKPVYFDLGKYPYNSMNENQDLKWIEIRANENADNIIWDLFTN